MMVILRENVDNLGQVGDIVRVSEGYARNFLLPRKLVVIANEANKAEIEHHKRVLEKRRATLRASAEELSKKLSEISCTITRKVGDKGQFFGSVTTNDIADALKKAGHKVEKSTIQLKEPLKSLGVHMVDVKIQPEVVAQIKVWIAKEE